MKKIFAAALLGASMSVAGPALAGTFLVEVGSPLGNPNGGGTNDAPKIRVVNTTAGSATTPYLTSFVLQLDASTSYTIDGVTNFGAGGFDGGTDNSPGVGTPNVAIDANDKSATFTYGATNFDPGAYSIFSLNFGPGTTNFRSALFTGTNTLTGMFSDGSVGVVTFAGTPTSTAVTYSFNSVAPAIPEPASWSLMIVGFGAIGGTLRTKRRPAIAIA